MFSHFFNVTSSFGAEDPEVAETLPKSPLIASAVVMIDIDRSVSTDVFATLCSRIKVRIPSTEDASLLMTFLIV